MKLETKNNIVKRVILILVGIVILGMGLGMSSVADLGSDSTNTFLLAMHPVLHITYGQMNTVLCIFMIIVTFIVYRQNIGLGTILSLFLTQYPMDFFYGLFTKPDNFVLDLLLFLVGDVLISLGAELIILAKLGMSNYEAFYFSFAKRFNINFVYCKYACDAFFLIIALIFGGKIGIGTIISFVLIGRIIQFFDKRLSKYFVYE